MGPSPGRIELGSSYSHKIRFRIISQRKVQFIESAVITWRFELVLRTCQTGKRNGFSSIIASIFTGLSITVNMVLPSDWVNFM
ncbi:MAG: hypothetical protein IPH57_00140 [Saprospiraceae bacterium]|nr:hypothetical protein [Saprospiraceae bacterium]